MRTEGVPGRRRVWGAVVLVAAAAGLAAGGYATRDRWLPLAFPAADAPAAHDDHAAPAERVYLSPQAQKNLGLTSGPLAPGTFWKTISVPGMVIDRPGAGDRGVVAPVTGVVARIHKVAGDAARPGDVLFTLKLLSESLHLTQTELFKAAQDIKLAEAQKKRLTDAAAAVPPARVVEIDSQLTRLGVAVAAYRQDLLTRGLSPDQIDGVADGRFVSEIPIAVPYRAGGDGFEVEAVRVELGQQVQAGQTLCLLASHQRLAVEGRAFRDEAPLVERTVRNGWPVEVDFGDARGERLKVTYVANTIDPDSRTFRFLMPLENAAEVVEADGRAQTLWRFRPGQRVRLLVRVEELGNVFVLPAGAVVREGADAYVFRRNGDLFDRKAVHVVYQDRDNVVVANDGAVPAGLFVARSGAAQLNRMLRAQTGAAPAGFHIHADGSVHTGGHQ